MYVPSAFREQDPVEIRKLLRANPFATLVSWDGVRPLATHLVLDARDGPSGGLVLSGHLSRANPQWRTFRPDTEVLAVFLGHHAYISPTWYREPGVPTWNYQAVHVYGAPRLIEDTAELEALLARLVERFEPAYRLAGLPEGHVANTMKGIVGFEIPVTRVEATSKLSQNKDDWDVSTVIRGLEKRGDPDSAAIAREMRRRGSARADPG